jgi:hypothetical protein
MKRILVTILSVLYMISATGATVHLHYCMGKFVGAAFGHEDKEMCNNCGMEKSDSKSCCKDIHKTIKASDHQYAKANFDLTHYQPIAIIPVVHRLTLSEYCAGQCSSIPAHEHAPPALWRTCPIYILVQNFRI